MAEKTQEELEQEYSDLKIEFMMAALQGSAASGTEASLLVKKAEEIADGALANLFE